MGVKHKRKAAKKQAERPWSAWQRAHCPYCRTTVDKAERIVAINPDGYRRNFHPPCITLGAVRVWVQVEVGR